MMGVPLDYHSYAYLGVNCAIYPTKKYSQIQAHETIGMD